MCTFALTAQARFFCRQMHVQDALIRAAAVFLAICAILAVSCILPVFQELSSPANHDAAFEGSVRDFNVDRGLYVSCQPTEQGCMQQENHILRQKVYSLRKQLGRLSCAADGVGPTGCFQASPLQAPTSAVFCTGTCLVRPSCPASKETI